MPIAGNAIDNNPLAALMQRAGPSVTAAIQRASVKTGVDFAYMMEKAAAESSFKADAKAKTSSAAGLYQFIESTWLQMVNRHGDKYGLGAYADKISDSGKVSDTATRREILALRNDPEIAALMAGEFAAENRQALIDSGIAEKDIGSTELYLAHFLGAGAASEFIKAKQDNPLAPAADIFPRAAKANHNVFYNSKTQQARSLGEVYAFFDKKFGCAEGSSTMASAPSPEAKTPSPAVIARNDAARTALPTVSARCAVDYDVSTENILAMMGATPAWLERRGEQQGNEFAALPATLPATRKTIAPRADPRTLHR
ncbi:MAG: hypothetical protein HYU57_00555 [Micavibrio aeruginosavorus]|nr:hypothetical protein [Micavibrio aeruginosavorus]